MVNSAKNRLLIADVYLALFFMPAPKDRRRHERCARTLSRACATLKPANHSERLSHLFHYTSLPFRERRVPPQFVFYVLHLNLNPAFRLFAVARRRLFRLQRTVGVVGDDFVHPARVQPQALGRHAALVVADVAALQALGAAGARHHRVPRRQLLEAAGGSAEVRIAVDVGRRLAAQKVHAVAQVESGVSPAWWFHRAPQFDSLRGTHFHRVTPCVHTNTAERTVSAGWYANGQLRRAARS